MSEHLRTDYDRMVGESYKEYAARMHGQALAAGKDRDEAAAKVRRLQATAGGGRCVECGQVETLTADGLLSQHHDTDTDTDEVCGGSGASDHEPPNLTVRVLDNDDRKELGRLREGQARLLAECDRIENHIRENVPHLSPDAGHLTVHVIRTILGEAT